MSLYIYGIIFLPVALWIFLWRPRYLASLLVLASVFETSPLVSFPIGSSVFEIKPYYFVAVLLALRAWPVFFRQRRLELELGRSGGQIVRSFVRFWKWGLLSTFLFPILFEGVRVIDPRVIGGDVVAGFLLEGASAPLHWGFENLGQAVYLTLNLIALLYVCSGEGRDKSAKPFKTLQVMIIVVSVIALVQFVAAKKGWTVPYLDFESNLSYAGGSTFDSDSVRRVNATFSEPSTAGGFLAGAALGLVASRLSGGPISVFVIGLVVLALMLTTSTTGYATLTIGVALLVLYLLHSSSRRRLPRNVLRRSLFALSLVLLAMLAFVVADSTLKQAAIATTFDKADTISFLARGAADAYSFKLLASTYGLGTGLGSNRPSGFAAGLLGSVGIIGTTLFVVFIARLLRQVLSASCGRDASSFAMVSWMLIGMLIAQAVAIPDLSWPPFWGVLIVTSSLLASRNQLAAEVAVVFAPDPAGDAPTNPALA